MWGLYAGTCDGKLVLFKTCQSVEGPKSKRSSMSPACKESIPNYMELFLSSYSHFRSKKNAMLNIIKQNKVLN